MVEKYSFVDYPRESNKLAKHSMFPKLTPPLDDETIRTAIKNAFDRTRKTRKGNEAKVIDNPSDLIRTCLLHLKERSDPIIGTSLFSTVGSKEVFEMDYILPGI